MMWGRHSWRRAELSCRLIFGFIALLFVAALSAQPPDRDLPLMPWPSQVTRSADQFVIIQTFTAAISGSGSASTKDDTRVRDAATRALYQLFRETGIPVSFNLVDEQSAPTLLVVVERKKPGIQRLGDDESYRLSITPDHVRIVATEPLGALRGLETFLQLVRDLARPDFPRPRSRSTIIRASAGAACRWTSRGTSSVSTESSAPSTDSPASS